MTVSFIYRNYSCPCSLEKNRIIFWNINSILKSLNCNMVPPITLKVFHYISTMFSTMSFFHANKTTPLFKQNLFTYFRFCNHITKFCFIILTTKDTHALNKFMFIIRQLFLFIVRKCIFRRLLMQLFFFWMRVMFTTVKKNLMPNTVVLNQNFH